MASALATEVRGNARMPPAAVQVKPSTLLRSAPSSELPTTTPWLLRAVISV